MEQQTVKLLIADDHEVVRVGLRMLLKRSSTIEIIGEARSVKEAIQLAMEKRPDVMLLDVRMPDGGGVEICKEVKRTRPEVRVLFLTSFADDETIFNAISAGADGYLLKEVGYERLSQAIEQVAGGQSILDPSVTRRVMGRLQSGAEGSPESKMDLLSAQERRVLAQVAEGKTNKEIAVILGLSDKTVKNYLSNAMDKLKMSRRSQVAAFYVRYVSN